MLLCGRRTTTVLFMSDRDGDMQMNERGGLQDGFRQVLSSIGRFPTIHDTDGKGREQQDDESFKFRAPFSRRGDGIRRAD